MRQVEVTAVLITGAGRGFGRAVLEEYLGRGWTAFPLVRDARVAESLMGLHRVCKRVVFLGSYPRADGKEPKVPYGGRDSDYQAALDWLRQVSPEIPRLPYDRT